MPANNAEPKYSNIVCTMLKARLTAVNKKVSYRKQIERQHSCHTKNYDHGTGRGRASKNFPLI